MRLAAGTLRRCCARHVPKRASRQLSGDKMLATALLGVAMGSLFSPGCHPTVLTSSFLPVLLSFSLFLSLAHADHSFVHRPLLTILFTPF